MSATTKLWPSPKETTPKLGVKVVKGYGAILGRAALMRDSNVDLPALGMPTRPTSAMTRSSRMTQRSSPGSPFSAKRGAWRTGVLNWALPRRPGRPGR